MISCGYDRSGFHHQEPGQPIWPELVVKGPEKQYHCRVEMDNALPFGIFEDLSEQSFIFLYAAFRKKIRPSIYILLDLFIGYV